MGTKYEIDGAVPYTAREYGDGNSDEIVALVTGFGAKPNEFDTAGRELAQIGLDSVLYTYHPKILLDGNPELLPDFIDTVQHDFTYRAQGYDKRRYVGASLGGAITANLQKRDESPEHGYFAATAGNAAGLIMKNTLFRAAILLTHHVDIKKAFEGRGHPYEDLNERWRELHQPPNSGFTVVLGMYDLAMQEGRILPKVREWKKTNPDIHVVHLPRLGHAATIRWLDENLAEIIDKPPHRKFSLRDILD